MLRINLLPSYVAQRRLNKQLTAAFTFAFIVVVAALIGWQTVLVGEVSAETTKANDAVSAKSVIDGLTGQATTIKSGIAPIQAKIQFFNDVQKYNHVYLDLYTRVAKWTSPKILYYGMAISGDTLTINAYTPSIEDLGRYLQVMYTEPDFSAVSISGIPSPDEASETIYEYKGQVIDITNGPGSSGAGGGGGGAGRGRTGTPRGAPMGGGRPQMNAPRAGGMGMAGNRGGMNGGMSGAGANIPGLPAGVNVSLPAGVVIPGAATNGQNGQYGGAPGQFGQRGSGQYGQSAGGYGQSAGAYGQSAGAYGQSAGGYGQSAGAYGQSAGGYGQSAGAYGRGGSGSQFAGMLPSMAPNGQGGRGGGMFGQQGGNGTPNIYTLMLADPNFDPKYFKIKVRKTEGYSFDVTCTLKQTFTPPTPPVAGGGAATTTTTGFGPQGMPGMPGVYGPQGGGMPGGMPTGPRPAGAP